MKPAQLGPLDGASPYLRTRDIRLRSLISSVILLFQYHRSPPFCRTLLGAILIPGVVIGNIPFDAHIKNMRVPQLHVQTTDRYILQVLIAMCIK
jgi:hypothetical protein